VQGVIRAKRAGYDCVLISLNGDFNNNILNLFLSSDINKRKDEYGGININNRVKILQ
jgi:2,4-dienoyl-CoA reductase-like NADH-dependent reductase (Old Yellow Enzyme family)